MELKGTKSYKAIMTTAKSLFWKYGIKRVTVEEICKEASVSKMTFYRSFKNKNEVAGALIDHLAAEGFSDYKSIMEQDIPFPEKVKSMLRLKDERSKNISAEFVKDIYTFDIPELKSKMEGLRQQQIENILRDFSKAQKDGWIRKDIKIEFILYMMNDMQAKIQDPGFLAMYDKPHDAIMEMTNYFFNGILSKEK